MPSLNGSETMVQVLLDGGIDTMFCNPGTTEMTVVAALDSVPGIRPVLALHENVVTGAADGYGRMKGTPAATLLHLGVGLANGIANLHNARRAGTPVLNIVGEMATWHRSADPLLGMDIESLAASVSAEVATPATAGAVAGETAKCLRAMQRVQAGGSRVATLVLPHDAGRDEVPAGRAAPPVVGQPPATVLGAAVAGTAFERSLALAEAAGEPVLPEAVAAALAVLRAPAAGTCLFVGGEGLWAGSVEDAGRVCAAANAALMCENAFSRVDRGAGRPAVARLPYFPADARKELAQYRAIVFVGARVPVAMFGYEDGISQLVGAEQSVICVETHDVPGCLKYFVKALAAESQPVIPASKKPAKRPSVPKGKLNASKLCSCLAALQPDNAIIVDESLTSGGSYWEASHACGAFTQLTLTGGAIGQGPPLSVGAAVACPDRRVINFQADGSGLYTAQALWTQAREKLKVTTVICNNSVYQILRIEQQKQHLSQSGAAAKSLTDLSNPPIDWVSLAKGYGVEAVRVTTCEELATHLERAFSVDGPLLIEAMI
ncbi:putative acetolactate synthase large subunit IlvX [Diplonema papillatum]|nr:putative acetolactate synthase large subunit IlvX [Diplonema papillatum]